MVTRALLLGIGCLILASPAGASGQLTAVASKACSLGAGGIEVSTLPAGRYSIDVRDRSATRRFHLWGPGINRTTKTSFVGRTVWRLRLTRGTYRFSCAADGRSGQRSFRVT